MKSWSDFYDLLMPDLPGCPAAAADSALRQSSIAFCEQSLAWQIEHQSVFIIGDIAEYVFSPPEGAAVHAIINAVLDGEEIEPFACEKNITIRNWRRQSGKPLYVLGGPSSLTLVPTPDSNGVLAITVALKPSATSTGIDDGLFHEYREAIIHGSMARLMLSPKKPYTNIQLAAYHQQQFIIKTAAAGMRVARSYVRAPFQTAILRRG
ncbi:hypothetical protein SAMN05216404_10146 [Nitrosospira multiformis]|uniref:Uncharacterized protein n=1 Tax=Nitrosospira multiformis TaxID=1231 RepID=A0A1H8AWB9_9PROT|nr:hypothetical protein [Nitrosospira multiformis]SEM74843.1 hypothetical protein SAMN05216404_10146 [Nitrosospira multiformis]